MSLYTINVCVFYYHNLEGYGRVVDPLQLPLSPKLNLYRDKQMEWGPYPPLPLKGSLCRETRPPTTTNPKDEYMYMDMETE